MLKKTDDDQIYVPLRWLVIMGTFSLSILGSSVYVGFWVQTVNLKLEAAETKFGKIDDEFDARLLVRTRLYDQLNAIAAAVNRIEGKLSVIERGLK